MTADEIRAVRERRSETQEDFAKHFGVARSTIAMWETNGTPENGAARHHVERILAEIENKPQ